MKKNGIRWWLILLPIVITVTVILIANGGKKTKTEYTPLYQKDSTLVVDTFESVFDYIFQMRIDHPAIVMAQCIEESGHFRSELFTKAHNCLGMKVPGSRPTHAVGVYKGHARFKNWHDCIADYAIWQSIYGRNMSETEYFALLDRIYAEKQGYSTRLKNIIKKYGL